MPRLRPAKDKQEDLIDKLTEGSSGVEILAAEETLPEDEGQEDAAAALKTQIEALKKSEETQRNRADQAMRDRAEAIKKAQEREAEVSRFQKEAEESQFDAIGSAIAASKAEAEKAQQDIQNAVELGDARAQSEAYRRLARVEANLSKLEDGKGEIESRRKEEPKVVPKEVSGAIEKSDLPETARAWLTLHPEYLSDARKNSKIQALHWDVVDEGHAPFSTAYFESLEQHLGMRPPVRQEQQEEEEDSGTQQRTSIVSAPVSREVPGGAPKRTTAVRLTVAQREAAKISGISEVEYAKQVQALNEAKANGQYSGGN